MVETASTAKKGIDSVFTFENSILKSKMLIDNDGEKLHQMRGCNYSKTTPTPIIEPYLAVTSEDCMQMIGLEDYAKYDQKELAKLLSGCKLFDGSVPLSHCYCGYQFGYFSGQLGDGRAISLGDIKQAKESDFGPEGLTLLDLQLKGSGLTPYSRTADGRAVLRSSIREFLCSEALHHLGIATTRAASLVVSDESQVKRDKLYTGNVIMEKCAVVMRVAPTFMRFGSFEIFLPKDAATKRAGPSHGMEKEMMPSMLEYLVTNFFPDIESTFGGDGQESPATKYQVMFEEITQRTAKMVAKWQLFGFCHGVLNTDNMSILGLTIDYGPFGFQEHFDPKFICNHSDEEGRYRYEAQPEICKWNLMKLAEALSPMVDQAATKGFVAENYDRLYRDEYNTLLHQKFGLVDKAQDREAFQTCSKENQEIFDKFWSLMTKYGCDMTNTFRDLSKISKQLSISTDDKSAIEKIASHMMPKKAMLANCKSKYEGNARFMMVLQKQPELLRLYGVDPDEAKADLDKAAAKRRQIGADYEKIKGECQDDWQAWVSLYKKALHKQAQTDGERKQSMDTVNPSFILRNYLLEDAIKQAEEESDFSKVNNLLEHAKNPFAEAREEKLTSNPPDWAFDICVSCSS